MSRKKLASCVSKMCGCGRRRRLRFSEDDILDDEKINSLRCEGMNHVPVAPGLIALKKDGV